MTGDPIPFTVLGGFLGSGKTTLVNGLLRRARGRRITVIVNDFGSVSIDAELIEARSGDTITLANGCICCSLGAELATAVPAILDAVPRPDHVVVEASGVADPRSVAGYGTLPGFRLDGVVVLADAEAVRRQVADERIGHQVLRQLGQADVVLLTKTDLVEATAVAELRQWLAGTLPGVRVVAAPAGSVPPELILDLDPGPGSPETGPTGATGAAGGHADDFDTCTLAAAAPLDREALLGFLDALPAEVVRAKGIVRLTDDPERETVVQRVGARTRLTGRDPRTEPGPAGRLVLIATAGGLAGLTVPSADGLALTVVDSGDALRLQDRPAEHHL